jgi:hypothetical protein
MKEFKVCVLLALFVGIVSYGLVFSACALNPKGSCSVLGFTPVQPTPSQAVGTNGYNADDPSDAGWSALIF